MPASIISTIAAVAVAVLPGHAPVSTPSEAKPLAASVLSLGGASITPGVTYAGQVGRIR